MRGSNTTTHTLKGYTKQYLAHHNNARPRDINNKGELGKLDMAENKSTAEGRKGKKMKRRGRPHKQISLAMQV